jgi:hypothetical protein
MAPAGALSKPCYAGYMYQTIMPHFPLPSSQQHATSALSLTGTSSPARVGDLLRACLSASPDRDRSPRPTTRPHTYIIGINPSTFAKHAVDGVFPCLAPTSICRADNLKLNLHLGICTLARLRTTLPASRLGQLLDTLHRKRIRQLLPVYLNLSRNLSHGKKLLFRLARHSRPDCRLAGGAWSLQACAAEEAPTSAQGHCHDRLHLELF